MFKFLGRFNKTEIAAFIALVAMFVGSVAVPVQSDITVSPAMLEFDSVGAMLRDMDREQSLSTMARHADLSPVSGVQNCNPTSDVQERIAALHAALDDTFDYTRIIGANNDETANGLNQLQALSDVSEAALRDYITQRSSLESRSEAVERFAAMALMMQAYAEEDIAMTDVELAAKVQAALRAAETALAKKP